MTTASRTTGVAPLAVFFDAVNTTDPSWASGVVQPSNGDYASFHYQWNFDDPASGNWTTGRQNFDGYPSKNTATGYVAAHVYDDPGTYTVTLTVTDTNDNQHVYTQDITVSAFSGTTYYVSNSGGADSNDGLSTSDPFKTFNKAMSKIATNVRILFNRGDSWSTNSKKDISIAGPGIIGAYGTGDKPLITLSVESTIFDMTSSTDWRIMDLHLTGPSGASASKAIEGQYTTQNLLYRIKTTYFGYSIGFGGYTNDQLSVVDCEADRTYKWGIYIGASRLAILGSSSHDTVDSHNCRLPHCRKGVISNSEFLDPAGGKHSFKYHNSPNFVGAPEGGYTIISDNKFRHTSWTVAIGPQDAWKDERIKHVVFERNLSYGGIAVLVWARQVTVRNNILICNHPATFNGVMIEQRGIEPIPDDVSVYNNTIYADVAGFNTFAGIVIEEGTNITVRNNLASAPNWTGYATTIDGTPTTESDNLLTDTPGFINASAGDFRLQSDSPLINTGSDVSPYVRDDYEGTSRPVGIYDIGAYEYIGSFGNVIPPCATISVTGLSLGGSYTSDNTWKNFSFDLQTGTFQISYDAEPHGNNIDALTMISDAIGSTWNDYACRVRFFLNGYIEAVHSNETQDGNLYSAESVVSYTAGNSYHFRWVINVPQHTYSVYVTPPGESEATIATDYAFSYTQLDVTFLNNLGLWAGEGDSHTVSNFAVSPVSNDITVAVECGSVSVVEYSVTPIIAANEISYFIDFEEYALDANPTDWHDSDPALFEDDSLFTVQEPATKALYSGASPGGYTDIHSHYVATGTDEWSDYRITGKMMISQPSLAGGMGVTFYSDFPNSDSYYRLRAFGASGYNYFHMTKHGGGGDNDLTNRLPAAENRTYMQIDTWFEFKIEVENATAQTDIRIKIWEEGNAEPANWQIEAYDDTANRYEAGRVGFWTYYTGLKYFDNLWVRSLVLSAINVSVPSESITVSSDTPTIDIEELVYVIPTSGTVTVAGQEINRYTQLVSAGTVEIEGQSPSFAISVVATNGSITVTGKSPAIAQHRILPVSFETLNVSSSSPDAYIEPPTALIPLGEITITGGVPSLNLPISTTPTNETVTVSGETVIFPRDIQLPAGTVTAEGLQPTLDVEPPIILIVESGDVTVDGQKNDLPYISEIRLLSYTVRGNVPRNFFYTHPMINVTTNPFTIDVEPRSIDVSEVKLSITNNRTTMPQSDIRSTQYSPTITELTIENYVEYLDAVRTEWEIWLWTESEYRDKKSIKVYTNDNGVIGSYDNVGEASINRLQIDLPLNQTNLKYRARFRDSVGRWSLWSNYKTGRTRNTNYKWSGINALDKPLTKTNTGYKIIGESNDAIITYETPYRALKSVVADEDIDAYVSRVVSIPVPVRLSDSDYESSPSTYVGLGRSTRGTSVDPGVINQEATSVGERIDRDDSVGIDHHATMSTDGTTITKDSNLSKIDSSVESQENTKRGATIRKRSKTHIDKRVKSINKTKRGATIIVD